MEPESITRILWQQAKSGDSAAFDQLFALHVDQLLVFIRARLGGGLREKIEPEDILQDAHLAAWKGFEEFDYSDEGAFRRWMCRIINNRLRDAHDYYAAKKRQPVAQPKSAPTGPLTALGRAETRQSIDAALASLSDDHRQVLLLRYFEGLSTEEAGLRMNRPAGAIRNLCARALVELGKHLSKSKGQST